jgi:hypothetical protein
MTHVKMTDAEFQAHIEQFQYEMGRATKHAEMIDEVTGGEFDLADHLKIFCNKLEDARKSLLSEYTIPTNERLM